MKTDKVEINKVKYEFISSESKYYDEAVDLRHKVFFEPSNISREVVFDEFEERSIHLVAIYEDHTVGYFRLTIDNLIGQLSQFVVAADFRGKETVGPLLYKYMLLKAKEQKVKKVVGEIRLRLAKSAEYYGFKVSEEVFPSKRTGIPHRRIEMDL